MRRDHLLQLLETVASGKLSPDSALEKLAWAPVEEVAEPGEAAFARIDHHRAVRQGVPEVVLCSGKTHDQVVAICERLADSGYGFLATRADEALRERLVGRFPEAEANDLGRTVYLRAQGGPPEPFGSVLIISAGTGDLPVAEEAATTAEALGHRVERLYDVGVAGVHRLLAHRAKLESADVVIVVAGMEGALPSVVGGLVRAPVIAVPTSVGYGASFQGIAALLGMLNSCAAGVTVVNIDNGFGAAFAATRIHQLLGSER